MDVLLLHIQKKSNIIKDDISFVQTIFSKININLDTTQSDNVVNIIMMSVVIISAYKLLLNKCI